MKEHGASRAAPTLQMTMTQFWNDLEGVSLAGRYWLKQCLSETGDDAWYLIRLDPSRDAAVRVRRAGAPDAEAQLALWNEAVAIDHPHIVKMFDAGRTEAGGENLIYAVCEYPDDFLAGALTERPLSTAEAAEVLRACVSALSYLHEKGFVHGALDPRHIMAFGDTIKLPSDTIRRGDPADDMWSLGMLSVEILTRQRPVLEPGDEAPFLPEPFGSIAQNTLRHDPASRWTIAEVADHLRPSAVVVAPEPEPLEPPEPVAAAPVLPPPVHRAEVPEPRTLPFRWIPIAGLAAAVALGFVFLRHSSDPVAATPAPPPAVVRPAPVAPPPPAVAKPAPPRHDASAIWRVVAFEYSKRAQAEHKARSINEKHPALHAEVFAPKGNRAPYFVSLGGRLTQQEAERLRREARAKGLPRDTFVRNFND
jgi:eukaryotic-like serine/threonine-protein kinase